MTSDFIKPFTDSGYLRFVEMLSARTVESLRSDLRQDIDSDGA